MAHLQYFAYDGFGTSARSLLHYSQAVRVENRIECSGQGGWDPQTGELKEDLLEEIDQAFANVELALRDAGGKGWQQVFRVRAYATAESITESFLARFVVNMKQRMPDHQPLLTFVGVASLGAKGTSSEKMRLELEVSAVDRIG